MLDRLRTRLHQVRDVLPGGFGRTAFSQEGEDLILERIFEHQDRGIYVDVGAHHPLRFSNTQLLYRRGWHGVNLDATPGSMAAFRRLRPRDVNLEVGIARTDELRDFYIFDEPALNTFDGERARSLERYTIVRVERVRCAPLAAILREHAVGAIDLLTVDVEGLDFEVLQTLDWDASRPRAVVTEQFARDLAGTLASEPHAYLGARGYRLVAKTFNSVVYVRDP